MITRDKFRMIFWAVGFVMVCAFATSTVVLAKGQDSKLFDKNDLKVVSVFVFPLQNYDSWRDTLVGCPTDFSCAGQAPVVGESDEARVGIVRWSNNYYDRQGCQTIAPLGGEVQITADGIALPIIVDFDVLEELYEAGCILVDCPQDADFALGDTCLGPRVGG